MLLYLSKIPLQYKYTTCMHIYPNFGIRTIFSDCIHQILFVKELIGWFLWGRLPNSKYLLQNETIFFAAKWAFSFYDHLALYSRWRLQFFYQLLFVLNSYTVKLFSMWFELNQIWGLITYIQITLSRKRNCGWWMLQCLHITDQMWLSYDCIVETKVQKGFT